MWWTLQVSPQTGRRGTGVGVPQGLAAVGSAWKGVCPPDSPPPPGLGSPVRSVLVPGMCERVVRHRDSRRLSRPEVSAVMWLVPAASQRGSGPGAERLLCLL